MEKAAEMTINIMNSTMLMTSVGITGTKADKKPNAEAKKAKIAAAIAKAKADLKRLYSSVQE